MSKVKLIAKLCNQITYDASYDYIGVDKGALTCLKENIPMVCALGDFDSIDKEEYELLNKNTPIIKLPEEKDESDGEYAITYAVHKGYNEIEVEGAIGGRIDHFMALYLKMIMSNSNIKIKDGQNVIYTLPSGTHKIKKTKKYISFFACEPLTITLKGFKYPLQDRKITPFDVYLISNELIEKSGCVKTTGKIVVMECSD